MSDNIYKEYKIPESGSGLYHKFEDGKTYIFRIASEPVVYNTEFSNGAETNISTKYAWVVWNVEDKTAQIMQLPVTGYRQIAAFAADDDYGDPTQYSFKITRTGTGLETKYNVVPSPKKSSLAELDSDAPAAVKDVDLVEAISSGKGVSNVNWLKDVVAGTASSKPSHADQHAVNDILMDADSDKPIDLSEIPF